MLKLDTEENQNINSIRSQLHKKVRHLYKIKEEFEILKSYIHNNSLSDDDINNSIDIIDEEIQDSLSNFNVVINMNKINDDPYCEFKGHCQWCSNMTHKTSTESWDQCKNQCDRCIALREAKKRTIKKNAFRYYDEVMEKKDIYHPSLPVSIPTTDKTINITNINNTNINNTNIIITNIQQNNVQQNYINTKDLIFNVIMTSNHENAEDKLKYIFTYLMCGASGKHLFPNESKHSKAVTFPVTSARYSLSYHNKECTLHGVLRYKYKKECSMTVKKLEAMADKDIKIKVTYPTSIDHQRHHLSIHDIDDMLYPMINQHCFGSDLQKFYIED